VDAVLAEGPGEVFGVFGVDGDDVAGVFVVDELAHGGEVGVAAGVHGEFGEALGLEVFQRVVKGLLHLVAVPHGVHQHGVGEVAHVLLQPVLRVGAHGHYEALVVGVHPLPVHQVRLHAGVDGGVLGQAGYFGGGGRVYDL